MALRVITGDRFDHLADQMIAEFAASPLGLHEAEWILVPDREVAREISGRMARRFGIAAQWESQRPEAFLLRLASQCVPLARPLPSPMALFSLLAEDPDAYGLASPALRSGLFRIAESLAQRLAEALWHRPDLFDRLETAQAGLDVEGPDPEVFQTVATIWRRWQAQTERPSVHKSLLVLAEGLRAGPTPGLPKRLQVFGFPSLSPRAFSLLEAIGLHIPVSFWQRWPSPLWLGDAADREQTSGLFAGLLRETSAWFRALTFGDDLGDRICEGPFAAPEGLTTLQRLRASLQALDPELACSQTPDDSLQVLVGVTPRRTLELLKDALVQAFEDLPDLLPEEVGIVVPNPAEIAPLLGAVFGPASGLSLPLSAEASESSAGKALIRWLKTWIQAERQGYPRQMVLDLLAYPPVMAALGLTREERASIASEWERAGVRFGLDAADRRARAVLEEARHTFSEGMDRALFASLVGEADRSVFGIFPLQGDAASLPTALGKAAIFLQWLREHALRLTERSPGAWIERLRRLMRECLRPEEDAELEARESLDERLFALAEEAGEAPVAADFLEDVLAGLLRAQDAQRSPSVGGIRLFAEGRTRMPTLRVLAILGLDSLRHPPAFSREDFDLLHPRKSALDPRPDLGARTAFLDAILAAEDRLILVADRGEAEIAPFAALSPCVVELLAAIDPDGEAKAAFARLSRVGSLESWDPLSFDPEAPLSHDRGFAAAAAAVRTEVAQRPFLDRPLALLAEDDDALADGEEAGEEVLGLEELERFFKDPVRSFLERTLKMRTSARREEVFTEEPVDLSNLESWKLQETLIRAMEGEIAPAARKARTTALLPWGTRGDLTFKEAEGSLSRMRREQESAGAPRILEVRHAFPRLVLAGRLTLRGDRIVRCLPRKEADARDLVCAMILLCVQDEAHAVTLIGSRKTLTLRRPEEGGVPLPSLIDLWRTGLQRPLAFEPRDAFEAFRQAVKNSSTDPDLKPHFVALSSPYLFEKSGKLAFRGRLAYSEDLLLEAERIALLLFRPFHGCISEGL